jgi:carbon starvation protein
MRLAYPLATVLCVLSVWLGFLRPVSLPVDFWMIGLSLYLLVAAAVPVWLILQPREFVSVQFLYLGIGLIFAAVLAAAVKGIPIQAPAFNMSLGMRSLGALWPMLFITIACGAISGFHGLVASGTTSKMIQKESDARKVGYLAMIGESVLALAVTLAVATGVSYAAYQSVLVKPIDAAPDWKPNPVLAFGLGVAGICEQGLGIPRWLGVVFGLLMVEGFVLDTLDVSIRLNRYLLEEIWGLLFRRVPALLRSFWFNAGVSVLLMIALAINSTAERLWPIFGSGNQLLAALSLVAVSLWLYRARKPILFTLIPGILVGVTTLVSLTELLFQRYLPGGNHLLSITAVALLILSLGIVIVIFRSFGRARASSGPTRSYEPGREVV